jgi:hypothetical protein
MGERSDESKDVADDLPLSRLSGIAKEVFESLGGGEAFIRSEREQFYAFVKDDPLLRGGS